MREYDEFGNEAWPQPDLGGMDIFIPPARRLKKDITPEAYEEWCHRFDRPTAPRRQSPPISEVGYTYNTEMPHSK